MNKIIAICQIAYENVDKIECKSIASTNIGEKMLKCHHRSCSITKRKFNANLSNSESNSMSESTHVLCVM